MLQWRPRSSPVATKDRTVAMPRARLALVAALLAALCGCEVGDTTTAPPSASRHEADKRPCPAVAVTYRDPLTSDPEWSGGIKDFSLITADGVHHLFHITDPGRSWLSREGELNFGHATSTNLAGWTTHPRIELRTGEAGWSPSFVWAPHVIQGPDDGRYYMFYTGVRWDEGAPPHDVQQRIGLATSTDLVTWQRYDAQGQDGLILDGPDHEQHPWCAFDTDGLDLPWEYDCRDPFVFDRGPEHERHRYLLLASVRLAPDASQMAIAYAVSSDLVSWQWRDYFPVTVGGQAESANLVAHGDHHYLFWTARGDADAVKVACSTAGVFGPYFATNDDGWLFGIANETHALTDQTLYLAFDDAYVLHLKRDLVLPDAPNGPSRVVIDEFTACDESLWPEAHLDQGDR